MSLDRVIGVVLRWAKQQTLLLHRAGQIFLRERRTLIGMRRLVADEGDGALVALASERIDGLNGRLTRPDDGDSFYHCRPRIPERRAANSSRLAAPPKRKKAAGLR